MAAIRAGSGEAGADGVGVGEAAAMAATEVPTGTATVVAIANQSRVLHDRLKPLRPRLAPLPDRLQATSQFCCRANRSRSINASRSRNLWKRHGPRRPSWKNR